MIVSRWHFRPPEALEKSFVLFIQYSPDEGLFALDCHQIRVSALQPIRIPLDIPWGPNCQTRRNEMSGTSCIFVCAISAQMFVKSEPSPLDMSFVAINSRFKLTCVRSLVVFTQSCCVQSRSNVTQARFKQYKLWSFFGPRDIINFLLKSLSVITSVQSKQICSFDELETHTPSIVLVAVEPIISATFKGDLIHQLQVTPLLVLARNENEDENENPSSETSRPHYVRRFIRVKMQPSDFFT